MNLIKFSLGGKQLIAVSNQQTLDVYNCVSARQKNLFYLYAHSVTVVDLTDSINTVLVGSTGSHKGDYAICELDMRKSQFDTNYAGHISPSTSLALNIEKQFFVSGSHDDIDTRVRFRIPHTRYT